jgi:hypothetical protein
MAKDPTTPGGGAQMAELTRAIVRLERVMQRLAGPVEKQAREQAQTNRDRKTSRSSSGGGRGGDGGGGLGGLFVAQEIASAMTAGISASFAPQITQAERSAATTQAVAGGAGSIGGAAIGSLFGPGGTLVGASLGGALGQALGMSATHKQETIAKGATGQFADLETLAAAGYGVSPEIMQGRARLAVQQQKRRYDFREQVAPMVDKEMSAQGVEGVDVAATFKALLFDLVDTLKAVVGDTQSLRNHLEVPRR